MHLTQKVRLVQILLTLGAFEFFGPMLRDTNASHLVHPDWVGHARFHIMWNIVLWGALGVYSLYLIWGRAVTHPGDLYRALLLQALNALAFWGAVVLGPLYSADVFDASIHVGFMNVNENILVFTIMSLLLCLNFVLLRFAVAPGLQGDRR